MNKINCKKHGIVFFETDRYGCLWCKIEKLEAENERYKKVLEKLSNLHPDDLSLCYVGGVAREALRDK